MNEQLARLIPTLASDPGAVAMLGWIFRELETGFAHVADVCDAHLQGRPLPPSLFGRTNPSKPKPARAKPDRANKPKRKPTAYNIFVKRKIEELKAQGFRPDADATGNVLFEKAVEAWKLLPDDKKLQFTEACKSELSRDAAKTDAADPAADFEQAGDSAGNPEASASLPVEEKVQDPALPDTDTQRQKKKKKHRSSKSGTEGEGGASESRKKRKKHASP